MKKTLLVVLGVLLSSSLGCARVRVEAPREPIKVDISMRVDIYQHVAKDIDDIEGIVSGNQPASKVPGKTSWLQLGIEEAYAQERLSPEVEQAALRRRDRKPALDALLTRGVAGENRSGLVEIRDPGAVTPADQELVNAENSDRMAIYAGLAQKNGTSVEEVKKIYAKKLQANAAAGTPVEVEANGAYAWQVK